MPCRFISGLTVAVLLAAAPAGAQDQPQRIEARGASFPYVSAGEGPPVVFLHGAFADHRFWAGLREETAKDHRFLSYTRRYYGVEDWPTVPNEMARIAQVNDLIALIGEWGGPAALVGMGNSGQVALKAAELAPEKVRAIVLFEPTLLPLLWGSSGPEGGSEIADAYDADMTAALDPVMDGDNDRAMRQAYEFVFDLPPGGFDTLDPHFRAAVMELAPHLDYEGGVNPGPSLIDCAMLGRVQAPVLLLVGSETKPAWSLGAKAAADCLPDATLKVIEGVKHDWPIADGPAFARTALEFIDGR